MPFYDLHCAECDKEFNILASVSAKLDKLIECPECGSRELKTVYKGAPTYIKSSKMPECPNISACRGCRHAP